MRVSADDHLRAPNLAGDLSGETRGEDCLYRGMVTRLVEVQGSRLETPYDAGVQIGIVRHFRIMSETAFAMQARLSPNAGRVAMHHAAPGAADRSMSYTISGNLLVLLPGCRFEEKLIKSVVRRGTKMPSAKGYCRRARDSP